MIQVWFWRVCQWFIMHDFCIEGPGRFHWIYWATEDGYAQLQEGTKDFSSGPGQPLNFSLVEAPLPSVWMVHYQNQTGTLWKSTCASGTLILSYFLLGSCHISQIVTTCNDQWTNQRTSQTKLKLEHQLHTGMQQTSMNPQTHGTNHRQVHEFGFPHVPFQVAIRSRLP